MNDNNFKKGMLLYDMGQRMKQAFAIDVSPKEVAQALKDHVTVEDLAAVADSLLDDEEIGGFVYDERHNHGIDDGEGPITS